MLPVLKHTAAFFLTAFQCSLDGKVTSHWCPLLLKTCIATNVSSKSLRMHRRSHLMCH